MDYSYADGMMYVVILSELVSLVVATKIHQL